RSLFLILLTTHTPFSLAVFFFFSLPLPPPRSPLFPYTTLFRSANPISAACGFALQTARIAKPQAAERFVLITSHLPQPSGLECRSEEHTSELQSLRHLVCRLLLEKKKKNIIQPTYLNT